ncbi:hypothetical protein D9758_016331 [Tetrapyrgos nigripes]|uniref:Uncharacterized protein n=1 Tax=Tetrapyrgos nigripes TaxID=182062 RepID=A0A8H5C5R7_9AGAR|nr:hypothetical protein D9758_016331 [Tetrapyrgos nigripes]
MLKATHCRIRTTMGVPGMHLRLSIRGVVVTGLVVALGPSRFLTRVVSAENSFPVNMSVAFVKVVGSCVEDCTFQVHIFHLQYLQASPPLSPSFNYAATRPQTSSRPANPAIFDIWPVQCFPKTSSNLIHTGAVVVGKIGDEFTSFNNVF